MREIKRSVKVALKSLIAVVLVDVNLPYRTSKAEDLVAFAAIVSNICTVRGGSTMNVIKVICKNNARPCFKRRMSFCACAKSSDLLKVT